MRTPRGMAATEVGLVISLVGLLLIALYHLFGSSITSFVTAHTQVITR